VVYDADFYESGSVYGAIAYANTGAAALRDGMMPGNWTIVTTGQRDWSPWQNNSVTFDAAGAATAFASGWEGPFDRGTASVVPDGNDGVIAWGRWISGTTGGSHIYHAGRTLAGSEVLHYVAGLPATNLPTSGTATYSMIGATPPSFDGLVTGASLHGSVITVNFGTSAADFGIDMTINGSRASHSVPLGRSGAYMQGAATVNVPGFSSSSLGVSGLLAGEGATHAGAGYQFSLDGTSNVAGAIAYRR
jgi:hypothetical protein